MLKSNCSCYTAIFENYLTVYKQITDVKLNCSYNVAIFETI